MPRTKRGLAWPVSNHPTDPLLPFTKPSSKISWLYNWSPQPTPGTSTTSSTSITFLPMTWNDKHIPFLPANLQPNSILLGFNEPERSDQSSLSPQLAAHHWMHSIEPLRHSLGVKCGSPGISSAPEGIVWLEEFLRLIRLQGSDVDFLCLHWYGETLGAFYDFLWSTRYRVDASKKVWVTEFACTNWSLTEPLAGEVVRGFMRDAVKYLDQEVEWVEGYAWFGAMRDCGTVGPGAAMLDGEGKLTALGREYRDG